MAYGYFEIKLSLRNGYVNWAKNRAFVWPIGRRDQQKVNKKILWRSWCPVARFLIYALILILLSQVILVVHYRLFGHHAPNTLYENLFDVIPYISGRVESLDVALFFATQGHHYFIERYLWKKEKDLDYMVKTGRHSLS